MMDWNDAKRPVNKKSFLTMEWSAIVNFKWKDDDLKKKTAHTHTSTQRKTKREKELKILNVIYHHT